METNLSINDTLSALNTVSVSLLKDLVPAFTLWILIGVANALLASFIFVTIVFWKPLHTDTQFLAANLAVAECIGAISLIAAACYHLSNVAFKIPETTTRRNCYKKVGIHYFMIDIIAHFHFVISLDRFFAAVFPVLYSRRPSKYARYLSSVIWVISLLLFTLSFFDTDDTYIPICLVRAAVGDTFYPIYVYSLLIFSIASVLVYCITMISLKYQLMCATASSGNMLDIKKRMHSRVTRALAFSAFTHFVTFTVASFGSVLIGSVVFHGSSYGPYLGYMFFFGGIFSFIIYMIYLEKFRAGFKFVCLKVKSKLTSVISYHGNQVQPASTETKRTSSKQHVDVTTSNAFALEKGQ